MSELDLVITMLKDELRRIRDGVAPRLGTERVLSTAIDALIHYQNHQ